MILPVFTGTTCNNPPSGNRETGGDAIVLHTRLTWVSVNHITNDLPADY